MKRINLCELKRILATEQVRAFVYATNKQNRSELEECEYIHGFSMVFDSFEISYLPAAFVLSNRFGRVVFHCVRYIEYEDENINNERFFTLVCKDRPFSKKLTRYNIVMNC